MKNMMRLGIGLLLLLAMSLSVQGLTITVEKTRVVVPDNQSVTIDLDYNTGIFNKYHWFDVILTLSIEGPATFSNGEKTLTKTYDEISKNIFVKESIMLNKNNVKITQDVILTGKIMYDKDSFGNAVLKQKFTETVTFLGVWSDKTQCVAQLAACEESETILKKENTDLKEEKADLTIKSTIADNDKETCQSDLSTCQTELDNTESPKVGLSSPVNSMPFDLPVWAWIILSFILGGIIGGVIIKNWK